MRIMIDIAKGENVSTEDERAARLEAQRRQDEVTQARTALDMVARAKQALEDERRPIEDRARQKVAQELVARFKAATQEHGANLVKASASGEKLRELRDHILELYRGDVPGTVHPSLGEPSSLLGLAWAFEDLRPAQPRGGARIETELSYWLRNAAAHGCAPEHS
jgi:hypothetical protein